MRSAPWPSATIACALASRSARASASGSSAAASVSDTGACHVRISRSRSHTRHYHVPRRSCRTAARMRRRQGGGHELSSATASCARTRGSAAASLSSAQACGVCLASGRMADESEGRGAARDAQVLSELTQLCGVARHRARSKSSVRRGDDRLDESPAAARTFRSERVDVRAGQQAVSESADVDNEPGECMRRGRLERLQRRRRRAVAVEPSFEHRRLRGGRSRDSTFLIWQLALEVQTIVS